MKRRRILLFLLCSVAAITLSIFFWPRESEPEYNGVRLSIWLHRYKSGDTLESFSAIRHIGTNATPFLIRWIQYQRPGWKNALRQNAWKLHPSNRVPLFKRFLTRLMRDDAEIRADGAVYGFEILGSKADPVRPELRRLAA